MCSDWQGAGTIAKRRYCAVTPSQRHAVTNDFWDGSLVWCAICTYITHSLPPCPSQLSVVTHVAAAPRESTGITIPPAAASIKTRVLPLQVYFAPGMALRMLVSRQYMHDVNYNTGIDYCIQCTVAEAFCSVSKLRVFLLSSLSFFQLYCTFVPLMYCLRPWVAVRNLLNVWWLMLVCYMPPSVIHCEVSHFSALWVPFKGLWSHLRSWVVCLFILCGFMSLLCLGLCQENRHTKDSSGKGCYHHKGGNDSCCATGRLVANTAALLYKWYGAYPFLSKCTDFYVKLQ